MTSLTVLKVPDYRLRLISVPVKVITKELCYLMNNMAETMYTKNGIGIAGNQVGILERIVTIDCLGSEGLVRIINPEIVRKDGKYEIMAEGCLSIPGQWAEVKRPSKILLRYLNENSKRVEIEAEGMLARCLQHEVDHLNGILFIDHLHPLKKKIILNRVNKKLRW